MLSCPLMKLVTDFSEQSACCVLFAFSPSTCWPLSPSMLVAWETAVHCVWPEPASLVRDDLNHGDGRRVFVGHKPSTNAGLTSAVHNSRLGQVDIIRHEGMVQQLLRLARLGGCVVVCRRWVKNFWWLLTWKSHAAGLCWNRSAHCTKRYTLCSTGQCPRKSPMVGVHGFPPWHGPPAAGFIFGLASPSQGLIRFSHHANFSCLSVSVHLSAHSAKAQTNC